MAARIGWPLLHLVETSHFKERIMALHFLNKTPNYEIGIWKMDEDEEQLLKLAQVEVKPTHVNQVRRMEYLAVRALALVMGIKSTDITYQKSGKPELLHNDHSISISHTKSYVAVMLSSHHRIGVDIEQRSERIHRIRHKFMHASEEEATKSGKVDETVALLLHWCAKEALFKAVPEDGIDFVKELRIFDFEPVDHRGHFKGSFLRTGSAFNIYYHIEPDFVLTCSFSTESI